MQTNIMPDVLCRMGTMRSAFRCQRQARNHRRLWMFYVEHNLFDLAEAERALMMEQLRGARAQWRVTLGWRPSTVRPRTVMARAMRVIGPLTQRATAGEPSVARDMVSLRTPHEGRPSSAHIPAVSTVRKVAPALTTSGITDVLGARAMNPPSA